MTDDNDKKIINRCIKKYCVDFKMISNYIKCIQKHIIHVLIKMTVYCYALFT